MESSVINKIYKGTRAERTPDNPNHIVVVNGKPLKHHIKHSPDGFEWGYGGSGPAELARCILIDLVGEQVANKYYQDFKWDIVTKLSHDSWVLDSYLIREWLRGKDHDNKIIEDFKTEISESSR